MAVTYTYDAAGNRTSETDPLGNRTLYEYDSYGRCTQITDPMGNRTSYAYDEVIGIVRPKPRPVGLAGHVSRPVISKAFAASVRIEYLCYVGHL